MISLAGRDILHAWGKFVFTGIGLGLLIGVTLTMAGVYRGMVDDGRALLDNSGADIWVVQQGTLGPYAEPSSLNDTTWRTGYQKLTQRQPSNSGVLLRCILISASLHINCNRNHFCFWPIQTGFVSQRTKRFGNL